MAAERKRARPRHLLGSPWRQCSNAHAKPPPLVLERVGRHFHPGRANRATRPSNINVRVQGARDGLVTAQMRAFWQVLDVGQHLRDVVARTSVGFMRHRREEDKGVKAILYPSADGVRRFDALGNRYASQQLAPSISVQQVTNGCFRIRVFCHFHDENGRKLAESGTAALEWLRATSRRSCLEIVGDRSPAVISSRDGVLPFERRSNRRA
jgi:hypothetical protein